jgi:calnexin
MIPDPKSIKPDSWLDNAPLRIPDPNAIKPADWDDEEVIEDSFAFWYS